MTAVRATAPWPASSTHKNIPSARHRQQGRMSLETGECDRIYSVEYCASNLGVLEVGVLHTKSFCFASVAFCRNVWSGDEVMKSWRALHLFVNQDEQTSAVSTGARSIDFHCEYICEYFGRVVLLERPSRCVAAAAAASSMIIATGFLSAKRSAAQCSPCAAHSESLATTSF